MKDRMSESAGRKDGAAGAAATLRLETCPSLFSSSSPPLGRTGISLSWFLVCLFTVWLKVKSGIQPLLLLETEYVWGS